MSDYSRLLYIRNNRGFLWYLRTWFNSFITEVPIIQKPANWFAEQINGLVSILYGPPSWKSFKTDIILNNFFRYREVSAIPHVPYKIVWLCVIISDTWMFLSHLFQYLEARTRIWITNMLSCRRQFRAPYLDDRSVCFTKPCYPVDWWSSTVNPQCVWTRCLWYFGLFWR